MVPGWCHRIPPATTAKPSRRAVAQWLASALGQKLPHSQSQRHFCFDFTKRHKVQREVPRTNGFGPAFRNNPVEIEICLPEKSPKTGICGNLAGDFRQFLAKIVAIRSLEAPENPILQAFRDYGAIYFRLTDCLTGDAVLIAPVSGRVPC